MSDPVPIDSIGGKLPGSKSDWGSSAGSAVAGVFEAALSAAFSGFALWRAVAAALRLRRDHRGRKLSSPLIVTPATRTAPRQCLRVGALASPFLEDTFDMVFGDKRGNRPAQRLGHRHGFDDPLTWLRQALALGGVRGNRCDGVGWRSPPVSCSATQTAGAADARFLR
jgi:hypothetical protein